MSNLTHDEQELLKAIKSKIEEIAGLSNKKDWAQKDYEYILYLIENETGICLSLSTLKRFWNNDFDRIPQIATLNALSLLAFKKEWLQLKKEHKYSTPKADSSAPKSKIKIKPKYTLSFISIIVVIVIILVLQSHNNKEIAVEASEIEFSYKKSAGDQIPNSVVFSYNVEDVNADKFYIQQSWDNRRRVEVLPENKHLTDIYYTPGYYQAKLIADNRVLKEIPVHIKYNNWFIAAKYDSLSILPFYTESWLEDEYLGIKPEVLEAQVDLNNYFQLSYYNVRDFGVSGDYFKYSTSIKMDSVKTFVCPKIALLVKGVDNMLWVSFTKKGCESEINLICSDTFINGKTNDLSMFGLDAYNWQNVSIEVKNKTLNLELNHENIFTCDYDKSIGEIKAINYYFEGIGSIDNVMLTDSIGNIRFKDDFSLN